MVDSYEEYEPESVDDSESEWYEEEELVSEGWDSDSPKARVRWLKYSEQTKQKYLSATRNMVIK